MPIKTWIVGEQVDAADLNNNFAQTLQTQNYTAGENISAGEAVYLKASDGYVWKADADAAESLDNFIGIAIETKTTGQTIAIQTEGLVTGLSGLTAGTYYYVSGTTGGLSATISPVKIGIAITTTSLLLIKQTNAVKAPIVRNYVISSTTAHGGSTSRFDITNPSGNTHRYTWDGTGTDPNITALTFPVGDTALTYGKDFHVNNQVSKIITASGANYFEITNASGVEESDKTLSTNGFLQCVHSTTQTWTKPAGLKYIIAECQGGGGGGGQISTTDVHSAGGGGGGYARVLVAAASLGTTESIITAFGGNGGVPYILGSSGKGVDGGPASFGSLCVAAGGIGATEGTPGSGGDATVGDLLVDGGVGGCGNGSSTTWQTGGFGGRAFLGAGASESQGSTGSSGTAYGGGGGGGGSTSSDVNGGAGAAGIVIVTEFY